MRFNSVRSSDFSQSAKAVNKATDQIFDAAMSGKPDFTKISQEAIKGRSLERRTATEAEGAVAKAGLDALRKTKLTRMKTDTAKEVSDIKRPAKRMAGIVAGLGAITTGYVGLQENKKAKAERAELRGLRSELDAKQDLRDQASDKRHQELINLLTKQANGSSSNSTVDSNSDSTSGTLKPTGGSADISSGDALDSGKGTAGSGKTYSQTDIQSFAEQAGFSPQNARIMAAISMGESRGNSGIDTVQSGLDPGKKNEYSIGLTQINVQAHQDKLDRHGWSADDLRDPVKNLTIAKEVYDEVGSFKPWSVYTSGKYNQYLK